jgi:flagellar motor switch protein FliN/FliY
MENHIRELAEWWVRLFSQAVGSMTGEAPTATWERVPGAPEESADDQSFWWQQPLSLGPEVSITVGTPEPAWVSIGTRSLKMAGIEEVDRNDARGTYLEILQQALASFAQSLSGLVGHEVTCEQGRQIPAVRPLAEMLRVTVAFSGETLPALEVGLSLALLKAISAAPESQDAAASTSRASEPSNVKAAVAAASGSKTLDLLMDVELPLSVSFGRAKLPLKDVIKLTTGSIVELNRTVTEPVEIIVNNCVIARGEVVVIEGNYGVKINQIVSRQERLRTLN